MKCITSRRHSERDESTSRLTYHGNPWGLPAVDPATSRLAAVITGCCRYEWAPTTIIIYSSGGRTLGYITIQRGRRMLRMYLSCAVLITCDVRNDVGAELCEADITTQYVDTQVIITKLHWLLVWVWMRSHASGGRLSFLVAQGSVLRVSENLLMTATLSVFNTVSNQRTLSSTFDWQHY